MTRCCHDYNIIIINSLVETINIPMSRDSNKVVGISYILCTMINLIAGMYQRHYEHFKQHMHGKRKY